MASIRNALLCATVLSACSTSPTAAPPPGWAPPVPGMPATGMVTPQPVGVVPVPGAVPPGVFVPSAPIVPAVSAAPMVPGAALVPVAAPSAAPAVAGGLDMRMAIAGLNELCGDTWCEGEWNYDFKDLSCEQMTCRLTFDARGERRTLHDTVTITGFSRLADADGELDESFYDAMTNALIAWEQRH